MTDSQIIAAAFVAIIAAYGFHREIRACVQIVFPHGESDGAKPGQAEGGNTEGDSAC